MSFVRGSILRATFAKGGTVLKVGCCLLMCGSCTALPPLEAASNNFPFTSSIPVHEIVQRVKCDLAEALYDKIYKNDPRGDLRWMQSWTVKSDLTLEINDTGGITPSFTYTNPLKNAFITGLGASSINTATGAVTNVVGATAQNFTLGVTPNLNGQVSRTETLSFTISLVELKDWEHKRRLLIRSESGPSAETSCAQTAPNDLQARLDLKSWLDEALKPVQLGDLAPGIHPDPGSAKQSTPAKPAPTSTHTAQEGLAPPPVHKLSAMAKAQYDLELVFALNELGIKYQVRPGIGAADECVTDDETQGRYAPPPPSNSPSDSLIQQSITAAQSAKASLGQASVSNILPPNIKRTISIATTFARQQAIETEKAAQLAIDDIIKACMLQYNSFGLTNQSDCAKTDTTNNVTTYFVIQLSPNFCDRDRYRKDLRRFMDYYVHIAELNSNAAQQNQSLASTLLHPDPPIESISQSMNFVVTAGVGVAPNWSLARWKGPSNGGSLASISGIRTHTLNVALGPPGGAGQAEVARVLDNQAFRQAVQSLQQ